MALAMAKTLTRKTRTETTITSAANARLNSIQESYLPMSTKPPFLPGLVRKSIVTFGLFSIVVCMASFGCSKPVAKKNDLKPESKEELRVQLQQRAAREREGL